MDVAVGITDWCTPWQMQAKYLAIAVLSSHKTGHGEKTILDRMFRKTWIRMWEALHPHNDWQNRDV